MNANVKFFISMAVEKVCAKLAVAGFTAEQAAHYITLPGHQVEILIMAESLHMQAIDAVIAGKI